MFTRNDLVDLLMRRLNPPLGRSVVPGAQKDPSAAPDRSHSRERPAHPPMLPKGRPFLSEAEIKKRLTVEAQQLTIPREAILSPLATDWLVLKGIKIVRE